MLKLSDSGSDGLGPFDIPVKKTSELTLRDMYEGDAYDKDKVEVQYEYDMGDSWRHTIAFLGRADPSLRRVMGVPPEVRAVCLGGEGHPVAEDSGGLSGWADLKAVFKKKKSSSDERKPWYTDGGCLHGDPKGLDPYRWDVLDVNDDLVESFPPPKV